MKILFAALFVFVICNETFSQKLDYTLEDRERLIRVEEGLKAIQKQIDQRFETIELSINRRLDKLNTFMFWGLGILFIGMLLVVSFTLWYRRSMISPVIKKNQKLLEENKIIKEILREYAQTDEKLLSVAKKFGLF
ncbi:MAG: hypothetical protein KJ666_10525 [Bacteroidetes bacterium]|nr:hypothetical protein [Bacteroidota bacterium]MBU2584764.1 hypothetical protein [Bacteroidota bacterium]